MPATNPCRGRGVGCGRCMGRVEETRGSREDVGVPCNRIGLEGERCAEPRVGEKV